MERETSGDSSGYKAQDIWNIDEMGCFWPDKGLTQMKKTAKVANIG